MKAGEFRAPAMACQAAVPMEASNPESPAGAPQVLEAAEPVVPDRRRRWLIPVLVAPFVLVVLACAAWAIDTSFGGVPRNVRLAGTSIGGRSEDELLTRVQDVADDLAHTPVEITSRDATYRTTASEIGLTVDPERTAARALHVGAEDFVLVRPFEWMASFLTPRDAPLGLRINEEQVTTKLIELEGDARTPPIEPALKLVDGALQVVAGKDGRGIDAGRVRSALSVAAASWVPGETIKIQVARGPVPPLGSPTEARAAASAAESLVGHPITLTTPSGDRELSSRVLRGWVALKSSSDGMVSPVLDPAKVAAGVRAAFADVQGHPVDATFSVVDGVPVIRPGEPGKVCCGADAAKLIEAALRAGDDAVSLQLVDGPPAFTVDDAKALGITQAIGGNHAWRDGAATTAGAGFTTYHARTGARVINIHRIADLVRGAVVAPGETFSINDYVGKRTLENGFVIAGAISKGEHVEEIGGGISQFATTTFNAAFFAGLDINESQAHSEYFDRYPRGREATMGFPSPDLRFTNNTPYGILIWPTYTSTSLTVTLYSTPYITADQTGITEGASGRCQVVTTMRTRTYPDGQTKTDKFRARYRPGPGEGC